MKDVTENGKLEITFSENCRPFWTWAEAGSHSVLQKPPLSFQVFHLLEDMPVLVVPKWQREVLSQAAGGSQPRVPLKD